MESVQQKDTTAMMALGRLYDLEHQINAKAIGRIHKLQAESLGDAIVLTGATTTYYAKQLAAQVAMQEYADIRLVNDIKVS